MSTVKKKMLSCGTGKIILLTNIIKQPPEKVSGIQEKVSAYRKCIITLSVAAVTC